MKTCTICGRDETAVTFHPQRRQCRPCRLTLKCSYQRQAKARKEAPMTLFRPPAPPSWAEPRPLEEVRRAISENAAAQERALAEHKPALLHELQEKQKLLFTERRRAEWAERGVIPEIIRGQG